MKNILIIKLSSLGDVLATTPFFSLLNKEGYEVDHLVDKDCEIITKNNPYINEIISIETGNKLKFLIQLFKLLLTKRYDVVFCFHRSNILGLIAKILGKKVYGFDNKISFLFTGSIKYEYKNINRTLQEYKLIKLFNPNLERPKQLEFYSEQKNLKFNLPEKYITCNPGGGVNKHSEMKSRRWLTKYFSEVCDKLPYKVVLLGAGKSDEEIGNKIYSKNVINLINKTTFDETALIIKNSLLYFGNDSSLLFLAASQNVPTLGIFGPTQPEAANPIGKQQCFIASDEKCAPCYNPYEGIKGKAYTCKNFVCMKSIKPNHVLKKILDILGETHEN